MTDDLRTIDATENLLIEYDPDDTWLAIQDKDSSWYDDLGSVVFQVDEIDALIEQLARVKNSIELRAELRAEPTQERRPDPIVTVAGGLAAKFLERRLARGDDVEIPSLGIVIPGDKGQEPGQPPEGEAEATDV